LSKQAVEYRLNKLIEKDIIRGFYPVINGAKMGYTYCRLMIVLQRTSPEKENEIINYLKKDPRFFWIISSQGAYDLLMTMWAKKLTEFRKAIDDFILKYGEFVKNKHESIGTNVIHYQHRYLLEKEETEEIHLKETEHALEIDAKDREILTLLCENARMHLIKIAEKTKISPKTAAFKIKRMEKQGIIEGYRPIINHTKLGYAYYKVWINLQHGGMREIEQVYHYLKKNPIVLYIVQGINLAEDLDIEVMVKNNQELFDFIKDLRTKFPNLVGDHRSLMYEETKKVRYLPS
jgi:DNA-binding Lrp family transcriptional regulator